jgi:hypothetical protein
MPGVAEWTEYVNPVHGSIDEVAITPTSAKVAGRYNLPEQSVWSVKSSSARHPAQYVAFYIANGQGRDVFKLRLYGTNVEMGECSLPIQMAGKVIPKLQYSEHVKAELILIPKLNDGKSPRQVPDVYGTHTIEWDNKEYIVMFEELAVCDCQTYLTTMCYMKVYDEQNLNTMLWVFHTIFYHMLVAAKKGVYVSDTKPNNFGVFKTDGTDAILALDWETWSYKGSKAVTKKELRAAASRCRNGGRICGRYRR